LTEWEAAMIADVDSIGFWQHHLKNFKYDVSE
jgi:hypothetical protein